MKTKAICTYEQHATAIKALRENGKYGEVHCPQCGGILQIGARRCEHGSLINERGQSLCELCNQSNVSKVSAKQIEAYLEPAIADTELRAHEQSSETESIADTNLMDGMEN